MTWLSAFYERADQSGIEIPENTQALRQRLRSLAHAMSHDNRAAWPTPEVLSVLALAQHYGVSTRLLDWSTNPLVAAYFAAKDACDLRASGQAPAGRSLGVFSALITHLEHPDGPSVPSNTPVVELVRAPYSGNPNLHAQAGVFTLLRTHKAEQGDEDNEPVEVDSAENFQVFAFALPWSEAPALLFLLARMGVSAATVFPGLGGVVESLREEKYWPKEFLYQRPQYHSDFWSEADET